MKQTIGISRENTAVAEILARALALLENWYTPDSTKHATVRRDTQRFFRETDELRRGPLNLMIQREQTRQRRRFQRQYHKNHPGEGLPKWAGGRGR